MSSNNDDDLDSLLDSCLAELEAQEDLHPSNNNNNNNNPPEHNTTPKNNTNNDADDGNKLPPTPDIFERAAAAAVQNDTGAESNADGAPRAAEDELLEMFNMLLRDPPSATGPTADDARSSSSSGPQNNALDEMFKSFEADPQVDAFIEGFAEKLMSKEVLYEPMKAMCQSYDAYLLEKGQSVPEQQRLLVEQQRQYARDICRVFEETPSDTKRVFQLVQLMEQSGTPPPELAACMFPGMPLDPSSGLPAFSAAEDPNAPDSPSLLDPQSIANLISGLEAFLPAFDASSK